MDNIRNDGTLDYKSFVDALYKFEELANQYPEENVTWKIEKFHNEIGGLVLIRKSLVKVDSQIAKNDILSGMELKEIDEKKCKTKVDNLILIEHQIVYNISYSVPVLYFKICFSNGKSLTIEEIWQLIPKFCNQFKNQILNEEQLITMITQFEHPIFQKPYFAVHPCKTSKLMNNLMKSFNKRQMNYILSWLSTIGPITGLNLRFKFKSNDLENRFNI